MACLYFPLSSPPALLCLVLQGCSTLSDAGLEKMGCLTSLASLNLSECPCEAAFAKMLFKCQRRVAVSRQLPPKEDLKAMCHPTATSAHASVLPCRHHWGGHGGVGPAGPHQPAAAEQCGSG